MAWTRVQGNFTQAGAVLTANLVLGAQVTSGNIICGSILCPVQTWPISIVDDKGNNYNPVASMLINDGGSTNNGTGFVSQKPITNSPQTITVTLGGPGAASFLWIIADEMQYSATLTGISIDGFSNAYSFGGSTTPSWTTYNNNNLVYSTSATTGSSTAGAGFTAGTNAGANLMSEFLTQTSPSNTTAGAYTTQTGSTWLTAFAVTPAAATTWQVVQQFKDHVIANTTNKSISFINKVAPGNLIVGDLAISDATNANITSFTDDKGNNYIPNLLFETPQAFANARSIFWFSPLNGAQTLTVTTSTLQNYILMNMAEIAPPPNTASIAFDGFTASAPGASPGSPPTITPTKAGDFFFSINDSGGAGVSTNGGIPAFSQGIGHNSSWGTAYITTPTIGSTTCAWSWGAGNSQLALAAFSFTPATTTVGGKQYSEKEITDQAIRIFGMHGANSRWQKY